MADEQQPFPVEPTITTVKVRVNRSTSSDRFRELLGPPETPGTILDNLTTPVTNVQTVPNLAPTVPVEMLTPNPQDPKPQPILPHSAIVEALQGTVLPGIRTASQERIRAGVSRLQDRLNEDRLTLYVPVDGRVMPVAGPTGFNPAPYRANELAQSTHDAFKDLLRVDPSIGTYRRLLPFAMSAQYDSKDTAGNYHSDMYMPTARYPTNPADVAEQGKTLYHEHSHDLTNMNGYREEHRRTPPNGTVPQPISELVQTRADLFAVKQVDEAHARSREEVASLLLQLQQLKKMSTDRASGTAELERIREIQGRINSIMFEHTDTGRDMNLATRDAGANTQVAQDRFIRERTEALTRYAEANRDVPLEIRTKIFLEQLANPGESYIKLFMSQIERRNLQGNDIRMTSQDFANLVRNSSSGDGTPPPSFLEDYAKANPGFDIVEAMRAMPWAKALAARTDIRDQTALMLEVQKHMHLYDPKAAERFAAGQQMYQQAITRPDYSGAVDAYRRLTGIDGNNFGDTGGGGGNPEADLRKIRNPEMRRQVASILNVIPTREKTEVERRVATAAAKEIISVMAQSTGQTATPHSLYNGANLNSLATEITSRNSPERLPAFIRANAPDAIRQNPETLRRVTRQAMLDYRNNELDGMKNLYQSLNNTNTPNSHATLTRILRAVTERAAASDKFFEKEIAEGTVRRADLQVLLGSDRTHAQLMADLDKRTAELKAREARNQPQIPRPVPRPPAN